MSTSLDCAVAGGGGRGGGDRVQGGGVVVRQILCSVLEKNKSQSVYTS